MNKCCKKELANLAKWELKITDLEKDLEKLVDMYWHVEQKDWDEL